MKEKNERMMNYAKSITNSSAMSELQQEIQLQNSAIILKKVYDSYIAAGFDEEQAFDLLCIAIENNKK